jgi:hypothetical protein
VDKPRLVQVTDVLEALELEGRRGELDVPQLYIGKDANLYADADELRKWRASQSKSEVK